MAKTNTNNWSHYKQWTPLLWRATVLVAFFVIVSGLFGPRIINNDFVNRDGFQVYGGAGKSLLFGAIALGIMVSRQNYSITLKSWKPIYLLILLVAIASLAVAWTGVGKLLNGNNTVFWVVTTHATLLAGLVTGGVGVVGPKNLQTLVKKYQQQLLISILLAIGFYVFLTAVYGLWRVLSTVVMQSVGHLLRLSGLSVVVLPPRTLLLSKFGIQISQYCSGIESIALFTALFTLIGILDWKRFNHQKLLLIFPIALILLFACNILRVYGLILAGYFINPHIAFSLFHTYAGMLFFILYSAIFWFIAYSRLLKTPEHASELGR